MECRLGDGRRSGHIRCACSCHKGAAWCYHDNARSNRRRQQAQTAQGHIERGCGWCWWSSLGDERWWSWHERWWWWQAPPMRAGATHDNQQGNALVSQGSRSLLGHVGLFWSKLVLFRASGSLLGTHLCGKICTRHCHCLSSAFLEHSILSVTPPAVTGSTLSTKKD